MAEQLDAASGSTRVRRADGSGAPSPVGERLRRERDRLGLSLRELARRLDVSPSLVSQIETGKIQPSVRTLYAIVSELGVSLDDMFELPAKGAVDGAKGGRRARPADRPAARRRTTEARPSEPAPLAEPAAPSERPDANGVPSSVVRVQRSDDRRVIQMSGGVQWERLTPWNDPDVDFMTTRYEPGATSSPDGKLLRHNGREFGILLRGRLKITVGFEEYVLSAGDSISFDSSIPHRLETVGNEVAETVWVVIGRSSDPRA